MDKAIILTGKEETEERRLESYQLLIGCNYLFAIYDPSLQKRFPFYEELSEVFAAKILEERKALQVGTFNGSKIDPESGNSKKIPKLEDLFVNQFSRMVCEKIARKTQPIATIIPVTITRRN